VKVFADGASVQPYPTCNFTSSQSLTLERFDFVEPYLPVSFRGFDDL
jgi:hypothetical protein